ncbi:MAG: ANTAR domain-containing protein [Nitriliruptor sp.]|nr:MAG: ANTAR domain-containing protein [Nitriliruptor sp.]
MAFSRSTTSTSRTIPRGPDLRKRIRDVGPWTRGGHASCVSLDLAEVRHLVEGAGRSELEVAVVAPTDEVAAEDPRERVGQAKGVLMARGGVNADTAFEQLRQRSQDQNRRLRDLAREIVADHEVHTSPGGDRPDEGP